MRHLSLPAMVLLVVLLMALLTGWLPGCSSGSTKEMNVAGDFRSESRSWQAVSNLEECVPGLSVSLALVPEQQALARQQAERKLQYYRLFQEDRDRLMNRGGRFLFQLGTHLETGRLGVGLVKSLPGLRDAVELDPTYCESWAMLGHLTSEVGNKHQAMEFLDTAKCVALSLAETDQPVDPELMMTIYRDRAWIYRDLARWEEGLAEVREGLEFRKGDHDLVLIKGLLLAGNGQVEAAQALAVRMKPFEFPDLRYMHEGLGMRTSDYANRWIKSQAYLAIGDIESASHILGPLENEAYRREASHLARFWNDVGLVKELAGDEQAGMYYSLAFLAREYGGFYPATPASLLPMVLDVPNPRMPFLTSFGRQFFVGGSPLAYAACQMELMSLNTVPKQRDAAARRALETLDIAQRRNIRPEICQAMRGRVHYQNEEFHLAGPQLRAARSVFREQGMVDAGTSQLLGMIELREDRFESAVPFFEEAVSADPEAALGWRHLGVALSETGRGKLAVEAMNRSLQLEPNSVTGLYNRGLFHCQADHYADAIPDLERALNLDPANMRIQQLLQLATVKINRGESAPLTRDPSAREAEEPENQAFDGNIDTLLLRLMEDLEEFFRMPYGSGDPTTQVEAERKALLAGYEEHPDPQIRRLLALTCLELGRPEETREILAPHWGADLDPDEAVMLLFADYKIGESERARVLGRSLLEGETGTENPYLWALVVQGAIKETTQDPMTDRAREMKLAFEHFVSLNVNFLGNPVDNWSRYFAEAFDIEAARTGMKIPAEWIRGLETIQGEEEE